MKCKHGFDVTCVAQNLQAASVRITGTCWSCGSRMHVRFTREHFREVLEREVGLQPTALEIQAFAVELLATGVPMIHPDHEWKDKCLAVIRTRIRDGFLHQGGIEIQTRAALAVFDGQDWS